MQFGLEKRLKDALVRHWLVVASTLLLGLAIWIRLALLQFESVDYTDHLKPWFQTLASTPTLDAFRNPTWNYTPGYIYLLKIAAIVLPDHPLRAIKTIALFLDAGLACAVYFLVRAREPRSRALPLAATFVVLFSPTVVFNGALWAQSDAGYAALMLLCLLALLYNRNALAFLLFGAALSLKLQATFLLPLLCVVYLRRRFTIAYFALIPLVYLVFALPAVVAGMPLRTALTVYADQFEAYRKLTYNAPTIYQWMPNDNFDMFVAFGTALALASGIGIASMALLSTQRLSREMLVRLALAFTLVVPFVAPQMHDRYFFVADVLSIVYAFYVPRRFFVPVIVVLCSWLSYFPFLFNQSFVPMAAVSLAMLLAVIVVLYDCVTTLFGIGTRGSVGAPAVEAREWLLTRG